MNHQGLIGRAREVVSRFPLTTSGMALLVGVAGLLGWTHHRVNDHIIHVVAWSCVGLLIIAILLVCSLGHLGKKHIARALAHRQVHCGDRLPAASRLLQIRYLQPPTNETQTITRRGRYQEIRFRLLDPFELISLEYVIKGADLMVLPRRSHPVGEWALPPEFAAGEEWSAKGKPDGDLYEIGEYRHGDPLRLVLWKITARRGGKSLYVRRPETVGDSKLAFYFMASPGDEATAELTYFMIREEQIRPTDLLAFSTDPEKNPVESEMEPLQRLASSGSKNADHAAASFRRFREESLRRRISACLVFLPERSAAQQAATFSELGVPTYFIAGTHTPQHAAEQHDSLPNLHVVLMEQTHPT